MAVFLSVSVLGVLIFLPLSTPFIPGPLSPLFNVGARGDGVDFPLRDGRSFLSATIERPVRMPETPERVNEVRDRFESAAAKAAATREMSSSEKTASGVSPWYLDPLPIRSNRKISKEEPLRVLITGGGIAGLVTATNCQGYESPFIKSVGARRSFHYYCVQGSDDKQIKLYSIQKPQYCLFVQEILQSRTEKMQRRKTPKKTRPLDYL